MASDPKVVRPIGIESNGTNFSLNQLRGRSIGPRGDWASDYM